MTAAIALHHLTKRYGSRLAVDDLSFEVQPGEVFGFVGPNGAGKTTTLRILAGLLQANSGQALVYGEDPQRQPRTVHRLLGYMPDYFGIYPDLKVWEYLDFFAGCFEIAPNQRPALIDGLLELVDLEHRRHDSVDQLSRGMKQRLSLARALIHDPQVLLLDEPASGLDPRARVEIRALLLELAHMGKTVFFSTHILADVAEICDRVAIMEAGKLVAAGTLEELHQQLTPRRRVEVALVRPERAVPPAEGLPAVPSDGEASAQMDAPQTIAPEADAPPPAATHAHAISVAQAILEAYPGVSNVQAAPPTNESPKRKALAFDFVGEDAHLSALLAALMQAGLPILDFHEDQRDLEEVFLRATQGKVT